MFSKILDIFPSKCLDSAYSKSIKKWVQGFNFSATMSSLHYIILLHPLVWQTLNLSTALWFDLGYSFSHVFILRGSGGVNGWLFKQNAISIVCDSILVKSNLCLSSLNNKRLQIACKILMFGWPRDNGYKCWIIAYRWQWFGFSLVALMISI